MRVNIKKGEVLEYLRNIGEGTFEVRIRETRYTANDDLFGHVLDVPGQDFIEENWVALNCVNGKRALSICRRIALGQEPVQVLAVVDGCIGHLVALDQLVLDIRIHMVLVPEKNPARAFWRNSAGVLPAG